VKKLEEAMSMVNMRVRMRTATGVLRGVIQDYDG
jgi:hypothetical protein